MQGGSEVVRIIVVGGGLGGTMVANQLVAKLYPEIVRAKVKVSLLSNSAEHFYKPAFMYVAFNQFFEEELKRAQRSLLRPEIDFQVDEVTRFDFPGQTLHTRSDLQAKFCPACLNSAASAFSEVLLSARSIPINALRIAQRVMPSRSIS